jgi:glycosyltransferase involved in cell wall biosynthesis
VGLAGRPKSDGDHIKTILLSAYACEPGKGSEPGVGWHWAVEIARLGHEVHLLTRANNIIAIQGALVGLCGLPLHIHGYDLPPWARRWKKGGRGVRLYYLLWQWGAYRRARRLQADKCFDMVHHITFGVFRQPSFMGRLGVPFVFGPVGGGESSPPRLMTSLPLRARLTDNLRSAANRMSSFDPLLRGTLRHAALIFCKTPETLAQLPFKVRRKCISMLEVAVDPALIESSPATMSGSLRFLFAGRLLYWKGLHFALSALERMRRRVPEVAFTIVGDGPDRAWLEGL